MGTNKRYADYYDRLMDERISAGLAKPRPITLPQSAYGAQRLEWAKGAKPSVWAWVQWSEGPATRLAGHASGWNDRVVIFEWYSESGIRDVVVWRNAVTHREAPDSSR